MLRLTRKVHNECDHQTQEYHSKCYTSPKHSSRLIRYPLTNKAVHS